MAIGCRELESRSQERHRVNEVRSYRLVKRRDSGTAALSFDPVADLDGKIEIPLPPYRLRPLGPSRLRQPAGRVRTDARSFRFAALRPPSAESTDLRIECPILVELAYRDAGVVVVKDV